MPKHPHSPPVLGGAAAVAILIALSGSPVSAAQAVSSVTLINADTNQPIAGYDPLPNGATLDLSTLPTDNLNIRANTDPTTVGSVRFGLDGNSNQRTETARPCAFAGDGSGNFRPWTPSLGSQSIMVASCGGAGGEPWKSRPIKPRVVRASSTAAPVRRTGGLEEMPPTQIAIKASAREA